MTLGAGCGAGALATFAAMGSSTPGRAVTLLRLLRSHFVPALDVEEEDEEVVAGKKWCELS